MLPFQVQLHSDGTWHIACMEPDPVLERMEKTYLDKLGLEVENALQVSAHFIRTGRVCACCSLTLAIKMRRCPCKGAYYCGKECQREHWMAGGHREVCSFQVGNRQMQEKGLE